MLIALLPGDGIGPEVLAEAKRVLNALALPGVTYEGAVVGGAAYKAKGHPLPPETLDLAKRADAHRPHHCRAARKTLRLQMPVFRADHGQLA